MRLRISLVDPGPGGRSADVEVEADPGTTLGDVRARLLAALGRSDPAVPLFADGGEVEVDQPLGRPPLVSGVVLSAGRPGGIAGRAGGTVGGFLELHVVAGPDSGRVHRLSPGAHRVGRACPDQLGVDDPDVSRVHAELAVSAAGLTVRDLGSTNGTWVDGKPVGAEPVTVSERSRVLVGSSTLVLRVPQAEQAATHADEGAVLVNRSPRIRPAPESVSLHLPSPPSPRTTTRFPVVAMLVPLVVALPLALLLRSPYALLIGVFSPLMILGNLVSDRVTGGKDHRAAVAAHEAEHDAVQARVRHAVAAEGLRRRAASPDAAELLSVATGVLQRIWERRPIDPDFLELRVGTATLPSQVTVHDPAADRGDAARHPPVEHVPVTVALAGLGAVGLAGPRPRVVALVRSLLGQVATLHSPRHVAIVILVAGTTGARTPGADWSWAAWLPHLAPVPGLGEGASALVGLDDEQVRRRVAELGTLLDARLADRSTTAAAALGEPFTGRHVVVLLDGAQRLRAVPGVARLLDAGPGVGLHLLCVDDDPAKLPVECRGTVVAVGELSTRLRVSATGAAPVDDVLADLVAEGWAHQVARGLAPLRDATPQESTGLPDSVRLLDELDLDATDRTEVATRWRERPRSTAVVLGSTAAGPFVLDLRSDGPHALVAGTTGSGKSELLQTLIVGLALANRPDELVLVLVDYKGGAAFAECAGLPHVVGLVTDLDGALTARALESLGAEVARREALLAEHGATDLDDYQHRRDLAGAGGLPAVPRLVLVVDEFRVLAEELPDFISGLVRLAAVGRSLGVHLVLATQRPAGVVSADIKANVNLRIALRVQDVADSLDVVDTGEAASLPARTPGRAVARIGAAPAVPFQAARVGGAPPGRGDGVLTVRTLDWAGLGDPVTATPPGVPSGPRQRTAAQRTPAQPTATPSDLARVVEAVAGATQDLAVPAVPSPWLPPLPSLLTLGDVALVAAPPDRTGRACHRTDAGPAPAYGLVDDPSRQRQVPAVWDLDADGPLGVVGGTRSGRSTVLRTLLAALATTWSPADAWAYVLDGGGTLGPTAVLPHVGAVVGGGDTERAWRLLQRLVAEVGRRQDLLARTGASSLAEQRAGPHQTGSPGPLAWIVVAVDGWEALQQQWDDAEGLRCFDAVHRLLREGPGVGVLAVVAGGRAVATGQLGALVGHRLVLRTADPGDAVMAGVPSRAVPGTWPPGRGVLVGARDGDGPRQVQVALLDPDPSGAAQQGALTAAAELATARHGSFPVHRCPPPVPPFPGTVDLKALLDGAGTVEGLVLGLGGPDVVPVCLRVGDGSPVQLVAGHPGSGRSTALAVLARSARRAGRPVVAVAPRRSVLTGLAGTPGFELVDPRDAAGLDRALVAHRDAGRPALVLVDDVEAVEGCTVEPVLARVAATAAATGEVIIGAGSTPDLLARFQGLGLQLRRPGAGLLLGPAGPTDGDVLGVRLPRREVRHPGRGALVHRGVVTMVQVALPGRPDQQEPT